MNGWLDIIIALSTLLFGKILDSEDWYGFFVEMPTLRALVLYYWIDGELSWEFFKLGILTPPLE